MFRGDRLKEIRLERDLTQIDLATAMNVESATISRYESGKNDPDSETIARLADYFAVSADYFLDRTMNRAGIPSAAQGPNTIPIPLLGVIRAGSAILATEQIEKYVYVAPEEAANGEYFYLRVSGDSMNNARICDGDLVFVRRQDDVDNRDVAVVLIDGENATIKRVIKTDGGIIIQPESSNPQHVPQFFQPGDDFKIIGKVMHVRFKLDC